MDLILLKSHLSHFLLFSVFSFLLVSCYSSSHIKCRSVEKTALLQFRSHFSCDAKSYNCSDSRALSWKDDEDCCEWVGVSCDNNTGYVVGLYLPYDGLYGKIPLNSSLFNLIHLEELQLSGNSGLSGKLPDSIGELASLQKLSLLGCNFSGPVPESIGNLIHLQFLDLSENNFSNSQISPLFGNLRNLTTLYLSNSGFSGVVPNEFFQLPNLVELDLSGNRRLSGKLPDSIGELSSVQILSLESCNFSGPVPDSIGNLIHLQFLDLSKNKFSNSQISPLFGNLRNLITLNLSNSGFSGVVPNEISQLSNLEELDLSLNRRLSGKLPDSIGNLSRLLLLDISHNNLEGPILLPIFTKFHLLEYLDLSSSGLSVTTNNSNFLSAFPDIKYVGLSNCDLSTSILTNLSPQSQLEYIDLSNNMIGNELDPSICNLENLRYLDLSHNQFIGQIPACLGNSNGSLSVLKLQSNKFDGIIPPSLGYSKTIQLLDLSNNVLQGSLPRSLANCTQLKVLNLGRNILSDGFPFWLGNLSSLRVLILRENKIYGTMSKSPRKKHGQFQNMHIIDMSNNDLTGTFPDMFFDSWNSMTIVEEEYKLTYAYVPIIFFGMYGNISNDPGYSYSYYYSLNITNKGLLLPYQKVLTAMKVIDFSSNNFHGSIPPSVGRLKGIQVLNLSGNSLTGQIPWFLGNLTSLESLDLSNNMFSGELSRDLSNLNFLEVLDLSQNNLSGAIPGFLDKFPNASFEGNQGLCGLPLSRLCRKVDKPNSPQKTLSSKKKHHFGFSSLNEFGWEVVVGYGGGIVFGMVIGYFIPVENNLWFARTFNFKIRQSGRRPRNSRSG